MKTLFFSLLTCALFLPAFGVKATPVAHSDEVGPVITISIELGRKSKDCKRIGICRISVESIENQSGPSGENTATGTAWIENGKLKIEFDRSSMTDATYQTHFASGKVQLEEDYVLPADVTTALGVRSYTIKTGAYKTSQLMKEDNILPVTF